MKKSYNPKAIEGKWQKAWLKQGFLQNSRKKGKFYILDMFPYPSGDGLHVGHVENFTATDIYARFKQFQGYEVLRPMGWDAFGLPAENFAIKTGIHPSKKTLQSIKNFKRQMKSIGLSYDWDREINTSSPEYYKWTQWMFLFLYQNGLAYKKKAKVNWCDSCQTVLANEQVIDGKCDRSGDIVVQKDLEQWFFKITDFVEPTTSKTGGKISGLLSGLEKIDWPESTKAAQKHWIGRSEGAEVTFCVAGTEEEIHVFTTRLDTIYGCTYVVIAPEHPLMKELESKIKNLSEVKKYIEKTKKKTDLERTELNKEKTGVFLQGVEVVHPFTGERLPVYAADYVLATYGTGAVMGVPAHDERDFEFASRNGLEKVSVIKPVSYQNIATDTVYPLYSPQVVSGENIEATTERWKKQNYDWVLEGERCFTGDGVLINSKEFTRLTSAEAREKMVVWLKKEKLGKKVVNYRLRDWLISRQRYWGAPIPIIYCDDCGAVPVPEKDLPVKLPTDVDFRPTGESPLVRSKSFHKVVCPKCKKKARRESDTMDTFVCSSWYYLRFADPKNNKAFASKKNLEKYLPVDFYMGGAEHTVLHLLYARFFTKALMKYGYVGFDEPFQKLRHQGIILAQNGQKMSKSKGNVVNPDQVVTEFGADSLRLYEMFMGPLEDMKAWNTGSIIGVRRFLEKVWKLQGRVTDNKKQSADQKKIESLLHKTIKKVTEDADSLKFNTAISSLMILVNEMEKGESLSRVMYRSLLILLSPFAPHIAEELWHTLGEKKSIFLAPWPKYDAAKMEEETVNMVVQVNGKLRALLSLPADIREEDARKIAERDDNVVKQLQGKTIRKTIFVPGKLINFVVTE